MNDKDLIEFFIYLRDYCYNRDFQIEPKIVVEDFRNHQYKKNNSCSCEEDWGNDKNLKCLRCGKDYNN